MRVRRTPRDADQRAHGSRDSGVALVSVLLVLVLFVPVALATLAIVVKRQKDVTYERSRTATAHAAEAGMDAATAAMRKASAGDGTGLREQLPCADPTPLTGQVGAQAGRLRYAVAIRYYTTDPKGKTETWRETNKLTCVPGLGLSTTPYFALLESAATGSQTKASFAGLRERSLETVYRFNLENKNIAGGLIRTRAQNNASAVDLCWAASADPPVDGAGVVATTCQDGAATEMFSYRPDLTFQNTAGNLCLTNTGVAGTALRLQACTGASSQKWVYNASDHIQAVDAAGTATVNLCIAMAQAYVSGTALQLSTDCSSPQTMWSPDSRTGPGGAGASQYQLVNFAQFARCFDVTDMNTNSSFMQLHPCKQSPTTLDWWPQQLHYESSSQRLRLGTPTSARSQCLTAPPSGGNSEYVFVRSCGGAPRQQWTLMGDTGVYATSYTIVDSEGRCLAAGPVPPEPNRTFSSIIVAPCDGSLVEKWNAPAEFVNAGMEGFRETTGG